MADLVENSAGFKAPSCCSVSFILQLVEAHQNSQDISTRDTRNNNERTITQLVGVSFFCKYHTVPTTALFFCSMFALIVSSCVLYVASSYKENITIYNRIACLILRKRNEISYLDLFTYVKPYCVVVKKITPWIRRKVREG